MEQSSDNGPCEDVPCSPFCTCSSCIPILDTPETGLLLPVLRQRVLCQTIPTCIAPFLPAPYHKDIWQPPKLG